jgi:shikimate kinase/3-dehydroquinate synthase
MEARRPVYEAVASVRVSTDGLRAPAVAEILENQLIAARVTDETSTTDRRSGE